jgi:hypothetical protein
MLKKIVLILCLVIVTTVFTAFPVVANTAANPLVNLSLNGDLVVNYDFDNDNTFTQGRVDQAVTIIFFGNLSTSTVDKSTIYAALDSNGFNYGGSTMYGRVNDTGTWLTNGDGGRKTSPTDFNGCHYRLYANGNYMWDPTYYHKYVVATTHKDMMPFVDYGHNEDAETLILQCALGHPGWAVFQNVSWFGNYEAPRWEGAQYWSNNGYGSAIRLP